MANDILLLVENIGDTPVIVSYSQKTPEVWFSGEKAVCEMSHLLSLKGVASGGRMPNAISDLNQCANAKKIISR